MSWLSEVLWNQTHTTTPSPTSTTNILDDILSSFKNLSQATNQFTSTVQTTAVTGSLVGLATGALILYAGWKLVKKL